MNSHCVIWTKRQRDLGWGRDRMETAASGDAGLERGGQMSGHAHRLDVLGLVVEKLAQLHGHQLPCAAPAAVKVCLPGSPPQTPATSGCSSTSALGGLRSHP